MIEDLTPLTQSQVSVDREAHVDALFRAEYQQLVVMAALLGDGTVNAEELVQDAFLGLLRNWSSIRDVATAPAYLRRSVVNLSRSRLRRLRTSRRAPIGSAAPAAPPEEHILLAEEHREVLAALNTLPRRQRECLVLRFLTDASVGDVAETLGISVGAVKAYTHRGLGALESILEER